MVDQSSRTIIGGKGITWTGVAALVVSVLCVLFAIVGPSMLITMPLPKAIYTYLLLAVAVLSLIQAWSVAGAGKPIPYVMCAFVGTVLLAVAAFYAELADRWVWALFWLIAGLLTAKGARQLLEITRSAGRYGVALSILNVVLAVTGPLYGAGYIETSKSIFSRRVGDETVFELAAVAMIPLVLLIFGVVGVFLVVRIRKAPKSQTRELELLLSMLGVGAQKEKKKGKTGPTHKRAPAAETEFYLMERGLLCKECSVTAFLTTGARGFRVSDLSSIDEAQRKCSECGLRFEIEGKTRPTQKRAPAERTAGSETTGKVHQGESGIQLLEGLLSMLHDAVEPPKR
jgi:hypothetical protein